MVLFYHPIVLLLFFTFPAASKPTMRILISFLPNIRSQIREKCNPIVNNNNNLNVYYLLIIIIRIIIFYSYYYYYEGYELTEKKSVVQSDTKLA